MTVEAARQGRGPGHCEMTPGTHHLAGGEGVSAWGPISSPSGSVIPHALAEGLGAGGLTSLCPVSISAGWGCHSLCFQGHHEGLISNHSQSPLNSA